MSRSTGSAAFRQDAVIETLINTGRVIPPPRIEHKHALTAREVTQSAACARRRHRIYRARARWPFRRDKIDKIDKLLV
jgi:hypothetical protein